MPVKMSDTGYEYECSRAELLGIPPPSYEEYLKNVAEKAAITEGEEQVDDKDNLEKEERGDENVKTGGRKLDEINNILQSTSEKLNRFKASYGSLTNVLKSKLGKSLDISFSQSEANGSQTNDGAQSTNANTDKSQEPIIGSIVQDKDKVMTSNRTRQTRDSADCESNPEDDEKTYKEIKLTDDPDPQVKSPEGKKFLNFGFLNLGSGK